MDDSISIRQDRPEQLNCLAAQRQLYSRAKQLSYLQLILSVPLIVIISIATLVLNDNVLAHKIGVQQADISWVAAFVGVMVTLIDLIIITPIINGFRDKAAKIQELFDTSVFDMQWSDVAVGAKPDYEEISKYSSRIRGKQEEYNKLKCWYSDKLDGIPVSASTVICQRSNLFWDSDLRKYFSIIVGIIAFSLVIFLLVVGLYKGLTLKIFFLIVFAPSLPIIVYATRQWIDNRKAISRLTTLKELLNATWIEISSGDDNDNHILDRARKLQDQIYLNRKSNPLIFDWIYELRKSKQHENMFYSIDQMIDEYERRCST